MRDRSSCSLLHANRRGGAVKQDTRTPPTMMSGSLEQYSVCVFGRENAALFRANKEVQ